MAAPLSLDAVQKALSGDKASLRVLVDSLTPPIQARVARVLLRTGCQGRRGTVRQEVEDLTQEVFERLFDEGGRVLLTWDQSKGLSLAQYVGLIAEREVISILRSKKRSPYTERPTDDVQLELKGRHEDGVETNVLTRQMASMLCTRLKGSLSPLGFRVFELLFCDESSPETVCQELNMTTDAVYAWRSRIRKTARELADQLASEAM
jgi:RNA polymerase sigma-70 factor (ECF subfamily)